MKTLTGKNVWITGASSGLGEALAYAFANAGARLILSSRRQSELERVRSACPDPSQVVICPFDLSETGQLERLAEEVWSMHGPVDLLVNNAGISQRSRAVETSSETYQTLMTVNFWGAVGLSQGLLKHFLARNAGTFVVISSVAGVTGLPARTGYCASKFAVEGFFASLRTELWQTPIRILIVRPGAIRTNIARNALGPNSTIFGNQDPLIDLGLDPAKAAGEIVGAVMLGRTELTLGSWRERLLFKVKRFLPGLVFNRVKKLNL